MKNRTFFDSIKCAFRGLAHGLKTEKNFKFYCVIFVCFLAVNFCCKADCVEYLVMITATGGVFSAELLNTAIEHLADCITTEIHSGLRIAKDIAASGVLVWGMVFFLCEAVIIGRAFL